MGSSNSSQCPTETCRIISHIVMQIKMVTYWINCTLQQNVSECLSGFQTGSQRNYLCNVFELFRQMWHKQDLYSTLQSICHPPLWEEPDRLTTGALRPSPSPPTQFCNSQEYLLHLVGEVQVNNGGMRVYIFKLSRWKRTWLGNRDKKHKINGKRSKTPSRWIQSHIWTDTQGVWKSMSIQLTTSHILNTGGNIIVVSNLSLATPFFPALPLLHSFSASVRFSN